jgi:hypothetical protein
MSALLRQQVAMMKHRIEINPAMVNAAVCATGTL